MLGWMRVKIGPVVIGIIIGFIAIVFAFYGVFRPKSTRGLHQGSVAGLVNGESISLSEFNRALNQRIEFFKQMTGGKVTEDQIKAYRIKDGVFNELVNRKLLGQEAHRMGLSASDEEIKEKIRQMDVFQKDGKFDATQYRRILAANNYSPASFERLMREDLVLQNVSEFFRSRARVSEGEIEQEFLASHDKRNIKYVLFTPESGRKAVRVGAEEIQKFLADYSKLNLAKNRFEALKEKDFKGKTFDDVKSKIAEDLIASEKTDEIRKINDSLADKVLPLLKAEKSADAKVNALLKAVGAEVKATALVSRRERYLPGLGDGGALLADAFDKKGVIDPAMGGKAKKYTLPTGIVVALVSESERPDLSKLEGERDQLIRRLAYKKEQSLNEFFLKQARTRAQIEKNKSVVEDAEEYVVDMPYDGG